MTTCICCGHGAQVNEAFTYGYAFQITSGWSGNLRVQKHEGFMCHTCMSRQVSTMGNIRTDRQWSAYEVKKIRRELLAGMPAYEASRR